MSSNQTIIVSNRMPVSFLPRADGSGYEMKRSAGGLVTALQPVHNQSDSLWVGVPGSVDLADQGVQEFLQHNRFVPVQVGDADYAKYYSGLSNGALWPLFHYFPSFAEFSRDSWLGYVRVNEIFCEKVLEVAQPGDTVWIHDYQLMLLPQILRERSSDLRIAYFHHVPFPASEVLRVFPWRVEILNGLLGADLVGFHTLEYARHFVSSVSRLIGLDSRGEDVYREDHIVKVGAFPLGIDVRLLREAEDSSEHEAKLQELNRVHAGKRLILGVDRLDYTKGIKERLLAFQQFLSKHPEFREQVVLLQLCVPSRVDVLPYEDLRDEIEWLVGRINGEFGSPTHTPVQYLFQSVSPAELTALYRKAEICLVTPLRDGLNLVCKEYVAAKKEEDGVLILSEFAGAAEEMGEALIVNPFNTDSVVAAIERALRMSAFERADRLHALRSRVEDFNNEQWVSSFFETMTEAVDRNLQSRRQELGQVELERVRKQIQCSERAILCVDFDSTFAGSHLGRRDAFDETAIPALALLQKVSLSEKVTVAFVSRVSQGVFAASLPEGMENSNIWLLAENGAYVRHPKTGEWEDRLEDISLDRIVQEVSRVLERCVRRVPRSSLIVQEKSIIWEFERANSLFAHNLALQTCHSLSEMLQNTAYQSVLGRRHLELRPVRASKLLCLEDFVKRLNFKEQDCLLTVGDSKKEDDLFRAFPEQNLTINLGSISEKEQLMIRRRSGLQRVIETLFLEH